MRKLNLSLLQVQPVRRCRNEAGAGKIAQPRQIDMYFRLAVSAAYITRQHTSVRSLCHITYQSDTYACQRLPAELQKQQCVYVASANQYQLSRDFGGMINRCRCRK